MKKFAIVPLKSDSRRLPGKNFLNLGGRPLAHYVVETLIDSKLFDEILIFCSDPQILKLLPADEQVRWLPRNPSLDGDEIKANELFHEAVADCEDGIIFLVQVTSPFLRASTIRRAMEALEVEGYDTVLPVSVHRTYGWTRSGEDFVTLNYDPSNIPQTQNLDPIFLETSGFYGFYREKYLLHGTRIHGRVKLVPVEYDEALDIDYPEDFIVAQRFQATKSLADSAGDHSKVFEASPGLSNLLPKAKIRHIVFDLDGVLVDSLPAMKAAWDNVNVVMELGIDFLEYRKYIGLPFSDILAKLEIPPSEFSKVRELYFDERLRGNVVLYPGALESLKKLAAEGILLSILTSKPRESASLLVGKFFPELKLNVWSPEDISSGRGKPAPDGLLELISVSGVDPYETVFVGDMQSDAECAQRAGIQFFFAGWGYGQDVSHMARFSTLEKFAHWVLSPEGK